MAELSPIEFTELKKKIIDREFSHLNPEQRKACFTTGGPVLILAGAGSGKTTVIVNRIAYLIKYGDSYQTEFYPMYISDEDIANLYAAAKGEYAGDLSNILSHNKVRPWEILAITFTNKAANEMKERIEKLLGNADGNNIWASTFHSTCAKILRRDGDRLGYSAHFTIYDSDDSKRVMKDVLKSLGIDEKLLPVKSILSEISRAKDSLIDPERYAALSGQDFRLRKISEAYILYQKRLKEADAMDFDDLIFNTVKLFQSDSGVLEYYQHRFKYILVDEYQDTNHAQYMLTSLLASAHRNICVVGDDNQSIYRFRGATIENILSFEKQYGDVTTVRLEQNYRSYGNILSAANEVINHNLERKEKNLWTKKPDGEKITVYTAYDERHEADFISNTILDNVRDGKHYRDHAVLYRMNAQSNAIENVFVRSAVPYRVFGGLKFYDRKEIKDVIAYLSVINNPSDALRMTRIINEPKRGIGKGTIDKAAEISEALNIPFFEVISQAEEYEALKRSSKTLKGFADMIRELNGQSETVPIHELFEKVLTRSGYMDALVAEGEEGQTRIENVNELLSNIIEYEKSTDQPSLTEFLENIALITDIDNYNADSDAVVLMTMHTAKGLEFPYVFIAGAEDGIFPGEMSITGGEKDIEEERRLMYVAITRAKEKLYITKARSRMLFGFTNRRRPSRFINEIPAELIDNEGVNDSSSPYMSFGDSGYSGYSGEEAMYYRCGAGESAANRNSGAYERRQAEAAKGDFKSDFKPGDRVSHKTFGDGTVLKATKMGNDAMLEIAFDRSGTKKLMAAFARIEKK
ncbi:MAG: ATP-dependent helicase [Acutalibacteraceae bacterium]